MPIHPTEYLRDLATRLRNVPVCHGVDGHDIDSLREVSIGIAELEKANVAYVDANTALISENTNLRARLFPYADATEIGGISWDGKYLIGDRASIKFFHEMKNRGEQIDVYKRAYDQNLAAKDAEIESVHAENNRLRGLIEEAIRCLDGEPEYHDQGMGCGLEDRGITDRYDAMHHGWEQAMERVYGENIAWAKDVLSRAALKQEASAHG